MLLYVVYTCQKSCNFINAFTCYKQKWPRLIWPTADGGRKNVQHGICRGKSYVQRKCLDPTDNTNCIKRVTDSLIRATLVSPAVACDPRQAVVLVV